MRPRRELEARCGAVACLSVLVRALVVLVQLGVRRELAGERARWTRRAGASPGRIHGQVARSPPRALPPSSPRLRNSLHAHRLRLCTRSPATQPPDADAPQPRPTPSPRLASNLASTGSLSVCPLSRSSCAEMRSTMPNLGCTSHGGDPPAVGRVLPSARSCFASRARPLRDFVWLTSSRTGAGLDFKPSSS